MKKKSTREPLRGHDAWLAAKKEIAARNDAARDRLAAARAPAERRAALQRRENERQEMADLPQSSRSRRSTSPPGRPRALPGRPVCGLVLPEMFLRSFDDRSSRCGALTRARRAGRPHLEPAPDRLDERDQNGDAPAGRASTRNGGAVAAWPESSKASPEAGSDRPHQDRHPDARRLPRCRPELLASGPQASTDPRRSVVGADDGTGGRRLGPARSRPQRSAERHGARRCARPAGASAPPTVLRRPTPNHERSSAISTMDRTNGTTILLYPSATTARTSASHAGIHATRRRELHRDFNAVWYARRAWPDPGTPGRPRRRRRRLRRGRQRADRVERQPVDAGTTAILVADDPRRAAQRQRDLRCARRSSRPAAPTRRSVDRDVASSTPAHHHHLHARTPAAARPARSSSYRAGLAGGSVLRAAAGFGDAGNRTPGPRSPADPTARVSRPSAAGPERHDAPTRSTSRAAARSTSTVPSRCRPASPDGRPRSRTAGRGSLVFARPTSFFAQREPGRTGLQRSPSTSAPCRRAGSLRSARTGRPRSRTWPATASTTVCTCASATTRPRSSPMGRLRRPPPPPPPPPPAPVPSEIQAAEKFTAGKAGVLTVNVSGQVDLLEWTISGRSGSYYGGAQQRSIRFRLNGPATVVVKATGPGGTQSFSRAISGQSNPTDSDGKKVVDGEPKSAATVVATGSETVLTGKSSACGPVNLDADALLLSGCMRPAGSLGDIPAAERGVLDPIASAYGLNRSNGGLVSRAVEVLDGYVISGTTTINGLWPVVPAGGASIVAFPQASALTSSNAAVRVAGSLVKPAGSGFSLRLGGGAGPIDLGIVPRPASFPQLGRFPYAGDFSVELGGGSAKVVTSLKLPDFVERNGVNVQPRVGLFASPNALLQVDGKTLGPMDVSFGLIGLDDLTVAYNAASDEWIGGMSACLFGAGCLDFKSPVGADPAGRQRADLRAYGPRVRPARQAAGAAGRVPEQPDRRFRAQPVARVRRGHDLARRLRQAPGHRRSSPPRARQRRTCSGATRSATSFPAAMYSTAYTQTAGRGGRGRRPRAADHRLHEARRRLPALRDARLRRGRRQRELRRARHPPLRRRHQRGDRPRQAALQPARRHPRVPDRGRRRPVRGVRLERLPRPRPRGRRGRLPGPRTGQRRRRRPVGAPDDARSSGRSTAASGRSSRSTSRTKRQAATGTTVKLGEDPRRPSSSTATANRRR